MTKDLVLEKICNLRPIANKKIGQDPIDLKSMIKRVNLIKNIINSGKFLLIGDDDFTSLALLEKTNLDLSLIEVDDRIINGIRNYVNDDSKIKILKFDLRNIYNDFWPELDSQFDGFLTDPPYTSDGMKVFISVGLQLTKISGLGFIACPYHPEKPHSLDLMRDTINFVTTNGFTIERVIPYFHEYQSGTKSSMIVVRKIKDVEIDFDTLKGYKNFYPIRYSKEDDGAN